MASLTDYFERKNEDAPKPKFLYGDRVPCSVCCIVFSFFFFSLSIPSTLSPSSALYRTRLRMIEHLYLHGCLTPLQCAIL